MPPKNKKDPKFLFDLHAVTEALTTGNNQIRTAFIDGLNSGEIMVPHSLSKELKDVDEDLYKDFQSVKSGRVYQRTGTKHSAMQQSLMDKHGTSIWGGSPSSAYFEMIAVCAVQKLSLVSNAKALDGCKNILKKCGISKPKLLSLGQFVAEVS